MHSPHLNIMLNFMKWYCQHLAACEPTSSAMLLSAGHYNSMQGLLKRWLEQQSFLGLLMHSPHFDMILNFMKRYCQHLAACEPTSSAMLLSAGHYNSMQGLLKRWIEQHSFLGLLMRSPHFNKMLNFIKWYCQHLAACEPTSSAMLLSAGHFNSMQGLLKRWLEQHSFHGLLMRSPHFDMMLNFMKRYCQHLAACEPTSLAMLLSAGHYNSMQGLLKRWLEQQSFLGLLMHSPHFNMMLNFMKRYCQHLAACEPTSSAMLLSAGHFNSMQGLLKRWLEQQGFLGLLMHSPHFNIMLNFMKWYCQHLAACEPTSSAMLLSAGHFNSMQGLLKRWLEQQSFHGLLMQPCLFDKMPHFMKWYCQHSAACEPTSSAMLLSAGHFNSMQGLLKPWLEQQSFLGLLMVHPTLT